MAVNAVFWTYEQDSSIASALWERTDGTVNFTLADSYDTLTQELEGKDEIDFVFTIVDSNDLRALYLIQQYQTTYKHIPLLAVFSTPSEHGDDALERLVTMILSSPPRRATVNSSANEDQDPVRLTKRQFEVLKLLRHGKSNKQIARELNLSDGTVKIHCMAIFKEIGATNRTQAALLADRLMYQGAIRAA